MNARRLHLAPDALLTLPVFIVSFAWAVVAHFTDISNNAIDHVPLRLALLFAVQLVFFAFPFVTWRLICPRVNPRVWVRLLVVAIILGAAVRGAVFGWLLFSTGLTDAPQYAFRTLASVVNMATVTVLLWFVVSEVRSLQVRRRQLLADRDQLLRLQESAQESLDQLGERATDEIRTILLASMRTDDSDSAHDLLRRLRFTIDDVVRPLSHRLAVQGVPWTPPQGSPRSTRVNWLAAVRDGLSPVRIHPLIVTIALIWLGLPVHVVQYGPEYALFLLGTGLVGFPVFWLMKRIAMRCCGLRRPSLRIASFVVAVLIGGESMGLTSLLYMQSQPKPYLFVIMVPIFALLISAPLAVAEEARDQSLAIEADLEATTASLRWTLARTRERHRQQEGALAHALHGRIQATLAAAIVRLDRAVAQGTVDSELIDGLHSEVIGALAALDLEDTDPESIDQVIALTQRNWADAVTITFSATPEARAAIEGDPLCARAVNDLIPELVFNGFRHGKATSIDISVALEDARALVLVVVDNGGMDPRVEGQGMGSQLLDAACMQWSRSRSSARTSTTCRLPWRAPVTL